MGGQTPKRTILLVSDAIIGKWLSRRLKRSEFLQADSKTCLVKKPDKDNSQHRVYGTKTLKATQAYPLGYGRAVARNFKTWRSLQRAEEATSNSSDDEACCADQWEDAELASVFLQLKRDVAIPLSGHF